LLLSLAEMAVQAGTRAVPIRVFVLWLVLRAEAAARSLVTTAPAPCPFHHAGLSRADAMRLARRLRNLARAVVRELDRQGAIHRYPGSRGTLHRHPGSRSEAEAIRGPESFPDTAVAATSLGPSLRDPRSFAPLARVTLERLL